MAETLVSGVRGHRSVWIKAAVLFTFAVFALTSLAAILGPVLAGHSFDRLDPDATTDDFLRILDVPHPGARLNEALGSYPLDKPLLFVGSTRQAFTVQVYYTLSYLAYPRPVSGVMCGEPGKDPSSILENAPRWAEIGGVIFFDTDPGPGTAGGTRISRNLYISPHTGAASWQSFCR